MSGEDRREIVRLRNAMGDVRGMQSDGATPEEMDRALALALAGNPSRSEFDSKREAPIHRASEVEER